MRNFTPPLAEDIRAERLDAQAEYEHALKKLGLADTPDSDQDAEAADHG